MIILLSTNYRKNARFCFNFTLPKLHVYISVQFTHMRGDYTYAKLRSGMGFSSLADGGILPMTVECREKLL
jgi:hypothetical protein